ncbi:MAG: phage major tail protein, TP901-1 family [Turicibacter sp.]|nr:phage major tail protein, TP901-1 family [Turicibacter sp.]
MSQKVKGCLYQIGFKTSEGVHEALGGGKDGTLNRSASTIDTTTRDSNGWKENEVGLKEWSFEMDGLMVMNDACYKKLEQAFMNDKKIEIKIVTPTGAKYEGRAVIADFPVGMPFSDVATYSVSATGDGALTITEGE